MVKGFGNACFAVVWLVAMFAALQAGGLVGLALAVLFVLKYVMSVGRASA